MRKTIILLFCIQIGSTSFLNAGILGEFFKIPALIEHLVDHHANDWKKCLIFLHDHYCGKEAKDQDHASFPFQNTCFTHSFIAITSEVSINIIPHFYPAQLFGIPQKTVMPDMFDAKGIWQPPGTMI